MDLLSRQQAIAELGGHFAGLHQIVWGAWTEYMTEYKESQRQKHTPTTRANIVHDLMVSGAVKYFNQIEGGQSHNLLGLKVFMLPSAIAIRFKKLDDELMSRNQVTQQVEDFRAQRQLDFLPPTHNLEVGYVLDPFGRQIRQICIVCPNGAGIYWDIELTAGEAVPKVVDIFDSQPIDETVKIVRPKKQPQTDTESDEQDKP